MLQRCLRSQILWPTSGNQDYSFFHETHGGWVTHLLLRFVLLAQGVGKVCLCFPHPRLLSMLTLGQIGLRRSPSESHNWVEGPSRAGLNGWHTSEEHFVRFHVSAWTYPHRFLSSHDYPSRACLWMTHNFHLDQWSVVKVWMQRMMKTK